MCSCLSEDKRRFLHQAQRDVLLEFSEQKRMKVLG